MNTHSLLRASGAVAVFSLLVGFFSIAGCAPQPPEAAAAPEKIEHLTIITPHNATIRQTMELGFADWCKKKRDIDVQIRWLVMGTPNCVEYIEKTVAGIDDGRKRSMPDLMFGGGVADHEHLAQRDFSRVLDLKDAMEGVPAEINGLPTRDSQGRWFATGLSSFGIFFNKDACTQRGVVAPSTWADLAAPRYMGWLATADPAASGSHRQAMVFILQKQGWQEGWGTLMRILGNSRTLLKGSADAFEHVESGMSLAGFAVNFDALDRAHASGGKLAYVNPLGATAATPDVISALRSQRQSDLAEEFIRYCLSDGGQKSWGLRREFLDHATASLYHYPIVPAIYEKYAEQLAVKENPFETDFGLHLDQASAAKQARILVPFVKAACGENHILLQKAWAAVIKSGMKPEALAAFCQPLLGEEAAYQALETLRSATPTEVDRMKAEWAKTFKQRFTDVIALCAG